MGHRNYQKELEHIAEGSVGTPTLLLHSCCAPCSSYCLEYLSELFDITVFYYNPNITEEDEYLRRKAELLRLLQSMPLARPVSVLEAPWDPENYLEAAHGLEDEKEGGIRCGRCFELRLKKTAEAAKNGGFDFFTTTLTISPLKNADRLNRIGEEAAEKYGVRWLPSDFKKKGGYQRSVELSREYGLYRQDYCGCVFSRRQKEEA